MGFPLSSIKRGGSGFPTKTFPMGLFPFKTGRLGYEGGEIERVGKWEMRKWKRGVRGWLATHFVYPRKRRGLQGCDAINKSDEGLPWRRARKAGAAGDCPLCHAWPHYRRMPAVHSVTRSTDISDFYGFLIAVILVVLHKNFKFWYLISQEQLW